MALGRTWGLVMGASLAGCLAVPPGPDGDTADPNPSTPEEAVPPAKSVDEHELLALVANAESNRRGEIVTGSFVDSQSLDGRTERIAAEQDNGDDRLEHLWYFDHVPAGVSSLVAVVRPYTVSPDDTYVAEYKTELKKGHAKLFLIAGDNGFMHYEATFELDAPSSIELRIKLPRDTPATGDPRYLDVDFLAIAPAVVGTIAGD